MNEKRKKVQDHILKHVSVLDPSGFNAQRYQKLFSNLNDKDFDLFIQHLRDKKMSLPLFVPNMQVILKMENIIKCAKMLGVKLFERLRLTDSVTGKTYLTPHEYMIIRIPVRRARQFLLHKLSVPDSDKRVDMFTGQVVKPDRASAISQVEAQLLYARGLKKTLVELVKVRGGDLNAYMGMKQQIEETGQGSLGNLETGTIARSAKILSVLLKSMHIDNNFADRQLMNTEK